MISEIEANICVCVWIVFLDMGSVLESAVWHSDVAYFFELHGPSVSMLVFIACVELYHFIYLNETHGKETLTH